MNAVDLIASLLTPVPAASSVERNASGDGEAFASSLAKALANLAEDGIGVSEEELAAAVKELLDQPEEAALSEQLMALLAQVEPSPQRPSAAVIPGDATGAVSDPMVPAEVRGVAEIPVAGVEARATGVPPAAQAPLTADVAAGVTLPASTVPVTEAPQVAEAGPASSASAAPPPADATGPVVAAATPDARADASGPAAPYSAPTGEPETASPVPAPAASRLTGPSQAQGPVGEAREPSGEPVHVPTVAQPGGEESGRGRVAVSGTAEPAAPTEAPAGEAGRGSEQRAQVPLAAQPRGEEPATGRPAVSRTSEPAGSSAELPKAAPEGRATEPSAGQRPAQPAAWPAELRSAPSGDLNAEAVPIRGAPATGPDRAEQPGPASNPTHVADGEVEPSGRPVGPVEQASTPAASPGAGADSAPAPGATPIADAVAPARTAESALLPPREQILTRLEVMARGGGGTAELELNPPELGKLRVALEVGAGGATSLRAVASTPEARGILLAQIDDLRATFAQSGLSIEEFSVELEYAGQPGTGFADDAQAGGGGAAAEVVVEQEQPIEPAASGGRGIYRQIDYRA